MPETAKQTADYILPLNINGLRGRMLRMPPPKGKKREIMYIYGHHASLERWFGVATYLNKYGGITVPDLPGFGGMSPFYKVGKEPTIDNMADYLAAFIKLRFKKKKFDMVGLSLGFAIITRMLQKYPEISKQVDLLVSLAGLVHKDDFKYKKRTYYTFRAGTWLFSKRLPAAFIKHLIFRKTMIKLGYAVFEPLFVHEKNTKIRQADEKKRKERIDFEVHLWQCNDPRTYMDIAHTMFTLDLTKEHVSHKVEHIAIKGDRYFNNTRVEQHMRLIFKDLSLIKADLPAHSPSVIATERDAAPFFPVQLRRLLNKKR